jgi:hypothetical protein
MDKQGPTQKLFAKIAEVVNFPELSDLCLTDINFRTSDLETCLKTSPLRKLVLKECGLPNYERSKLIELLQRKYSMQGSTIEMQWQDRETGLGGVVDVNSGEMMPARFVIRQVLIWP